MAVKALAVVVNDPLGVLVALVRVGVRDRSPDLGVHGLALRIRLDGPSEREVAAYGASASALPDLVLLWADYSDGIGLLAISRIADDGVGIELGPSAWIRPAVCSKRCVLDSSLVEH